MTIELGISSFECDCGCMIYPPSTISTRAKKKHIEKIELPTTHKKITQEMLLPKKFYDEIQAGLHDDNPNLVRFKGKKYAEGADEIGCIKTLRGEYKTWCDDFVILKRAEAGTKEIEFKKNAKNVTKVETEDAITLEAERFESIYEGTDKQGRTKCPKCGNVLCGWKT